MTPEEMRVAILEKLGWKLLHWVRDDCECSGWRDPNGKQCRPPPELTLDLLHEAEKVLLKVKVKPYLKALRSITGMDYFEEVTEFNYVHATAQQRATAFARTLWPERFGEE